MKIEPVAPKRYHCGQLARALRPAHAAIIAAHGVKAHRNITDFFLNSYLVRAWTIDGKIAALAGVTGSAMETEGIAWLVLSAEAEKHPIPVARRAFEFMKLAHVTKHNLQIVVMANDKKAIQFAYFLDFQIDKRDEFGGVPSVLMSTRVRKAA